MKRLLSLILSMILPLLAKSETNSPSQAEYVSLDGKPLPAGNPIEERPNAYLVTHFQTPLLRLFRTTVPAPRGTVILCPGGGYSILEMRNEGENTALFLTGQGFDVAILEYHVAAGPQTRDLALADALKTFRLIKSSARSLGLHNGLIDIMGYSAGGHLAARATMTLNQNEKPDGVILIYPAYLDETLPGKRTLAVVPPHNPGPLFALIAVNDDSLRVKSCQAFATAWKTAGGNATFHLLPDGGHGFGMAPTIAASNLRWPDLLTPFFETQLTAASTQSSR